MSNKESNIEMNDYWFSQLSLFVLFINAKNHLKTRKGGKKWMELRITICFIDLVLPLWKLKKENE